MSTLHSVNRAIIVRPDVTVPANGDRLIDTTTDLLNLPAASVGAYQEFANSGNPVARAGANVVAGKWLEFIYRNDPAFFANLPERELERTGKIEPRSMCGVTIRREDPRRGNNEIHVLEASFNASSTNGAFVPQDNFSYLVITRQKGAMTDLFNGTANSSAGKQVNYFSPDFTALGLNNAAKRDLILANIARNHNSQRTPDANRIVAFNLTNVNVTGATQISTLTLGQQVLIGYKQSGEADYLTISNDMLATFARIATDGTTLPTDGGTSAVANWYIIPYLLADTTVMPTTGFTTVAGTSGATVRAVHTMFLCLDGTRPTYDERNDFKTGLELGLTSGFTEFGASQAKLSSPLEPINDSHNIYMLYRGENYRRYAEQAGRRYDYIHIEYPNELVANGYYHVYQIEWCSTNTSNMGAYHQNRKIVHIAVPAQTFGGSTAVNALYTGVAHDAVAYLNAVLNDFDTKNNLGNDNL